MNARKMLSCVVVCAAGLCATPALIASPLHWSSPLHASFGKGKMVKFLVRNSSTEAVELRAGDTVQTVEAGKTVRFEVPAGTRILANKSSGKYAAGDVIAQAQPELSGNTVVLH